jgi:hypothetical protein
MLSMNLRFLRTVIASVALSGVVLMADPIPTVTVDLKATVADRFMGLGVQWDPYEYPPAEAEWKLTLARLDFMQPAFFRVMWTATPYCLGFDEAGKPQYVWELGEDKVRERLGPLFAILDYAQSRGIDVMLGEWNQPKGFAGPADPRWARIVADFVQYLTTQKKYRVIRYYNLFNEPNGNWMWPQGKVDYAAWAAGIRLLRQEFDARGLKGLPIAGPDNSGNWEWLDRCARELHDEIGFWEMHWYVKDKELFDGDVERLLRAKREMLLGTDPQVASKSLYMGEAGIIQGRVNGDQQPRVKDYDYGVLMADFVAQVARAGWMGASAWDLDDALHVVNGRKHPAIPDDLTLKIWGFWNTQGRAMDHAEDEAIRPWFYTWSLMSRLFPKGSRVAEVKESDFPAGLRTVAASDANGVSVMVVNDAAGQRTVAVRIPGLRGKKLVQYHYFDGDRPVDSDGFPVAQKKMLKVDGKGAVRVELPSRGVVFLSSHVN